MDGEAFDRLTMAVHRLRDQATRRNALRLLFGGAAVAAVGLPAEDAEARRKKRRRKKNKRRKKCVNYGARCNNNKHCCDGKCKRFNGGLKFCMPKGGGGGGGGGNKRCGGQRCRNGEECCRFNGVKLCLPKGDIRCGGSNICPGGWETCGWNGPVRACCTPGNHCCGNDHCCPDGWRCGDIACYANQDAAVSGESTDSREFSDPVSADEIDPAEFE